MRERLSSSFLRRRSAHFVINGEEVADIPLTDEVGEEEEEEEEPDGLRREEEEINDPGGVL